MGNPSRGEVWLCDLEPTKGHEQAGSNRTCIVVSTNGLNHGDTGMIIVCPMTKTDRGFPSHVKVSANESKLNYDSFIECEQIRSISIKRLTNKVGVQVPGHIMAKVEKVLDFLLRR